MSDKRVPLREGRGEKPTTPRPDPKSIYKEITPAGQRPPSGSGDKKK